MKMLWRNVEKIIGMKDKLYTIKFPFIERPSLEENKEKRNALFLEAD